MSEILGKVTGCIEVPRGPDVSLRIAVPRLWLFEGRSIEIELPRNLVCANCSGGGCGRCQQSGAISVRGRNELPEMVQVCLPEQGDARTRESMRELAQRDGLESKALVSGRVVSKSVRPLTIRIPECGGLPDSDLTAQVRGWLFLHVGIADEPSAYVRLLDDDEPLSSSKMIRAEAKRVPVSDPDLSEADLPDVVRGRETATSEPPPSTRVAKVRSLRAEAKPTFLGPAKIELLRHPRRTIAFSLVIVVAILLLWSWFQR